MAYLTTQRFIEQEGGGSDVFVHATAIERSDLNSLVEGQKVSFDIVEDQRSGRSSAENLRAA